MLKKMLAMLTIRSVVIELTVSCIPMNQPLNANRLKVAGAAQILMKKYCRARSLTSSELSTTRKASFVNGHCMARSRTVSEHSTTRNAAFAKGHCISNMPRAISMANPTPRARILPHSLVLPAP